MIRPLQIATGDTLPWNFEFRDDTGAPVDLTSCTLKLTARKRNATTNKIEDAAMTIVSASGGTAKYEPTTDDTDTPGTYDLEVKITDTNSDIQRNFALIPLEIREKLF